MRTAPTTARNAGDGKPWTHMLEHDEEREILPKVKLDDGTLVYL
jgi:monooxygenase